MMMNDLSHHYHLDESTFIFRGTRSDFVFIQFFYIFIKANRISPNGTPSFATSHLGVFCLRLSHDTRASDSYEFNLKFERRDRWQIMSIQVSM